MLENNFKFITDREGIEEIINDENLVFFIGMLHPRQLGAALFATKLEYLYFPPKTEKNRDFLFGQGEMGGTIWFFAGIPKKNMDLAEKTAEECGLRINRGFPRIFPKKIPLSDKNIFYLENTSDYKDFWKIESLIKKENEEIKEIREDPKKYLEKKKNKLKPVEIQWEKNDDE